MTEADVDAQIVQKLFPRPEDQQILTMFCEKMRLIDSVVKVVAMEGAKGSGPIVFALTRGDEGIPLAEEFRDVFGVAKDFKGLLDIRPIITEIEFAEDLKRVKGLGNRARVVLWERPSGKTPKA